MVLSVVIAACDAGVCEFDFTMFRNVVNTFFGLSLWLRLFANSVQFFVCCSLIFSFICSLSDWTVLAVSGEIGGGVECRTVSLVSMRRFISGVKLGLWTRRLPLGMCV